MRINRADAVVFKFHAASQSAARVARAAASAARTQSLSVAEASVNLSLDGAETYAYLLLREPADVAAALLATAFARSAGIPAADAVRLSRLQDLRGAAHGAAVLFHYVVETDVVPAAEGDFNDWYDTEHLPGLASVPGTIRAQRFLGLDGGPRYHSCYELVSSETLGSAPWLAVRRTAWSDRVRPNFRNTKRTMFRRLRFPERSGRPE